MNDVKDWRRVQAGDALPVFDAPAISRTTLALFAGASGDHNPMHIDSDFARAAGEDDVFAHGMLAMAYLAQVLTRWAPQPALRSYRARFVAITRLGESLRCEGCVLRVYQQDGEQRAQLQLRAADQRGETKLIGEAVVALAAPA
ncbi:dehydratase [Pseudomonas sp. MWU13-2860]|nr:dehydratase [Pseudomonas sp. MWU13-2860]